MEFKALVLSVLAGFIPALVWLLFWIREDRKHPEPKKLLALGFAAGMLSILPALWFERFAATYLLHGPMLIIWWSLIEETLKFLFAYMMVLRNKEADEPVDYVIYMVAAALGFAAVENAFFIFGPTSPGGFGLESIWTGNVRFIGATLLHVVTSSAIGVSMALAFYKNVARKRQYLAFGLILAIALHAAFNLTIMISDGKSGLAASTLVWVGVIAILLLFEQVKKVHPTNYS